MIKIFKPGFYASVQDLGRVGFRNIGVPVSGVMDKYSAARANQIVDNSAHDALLEITLGGTLLKIEREHIICVSGANFNVTLNHQFFPLNTAREVKPGDLLSFKSPQQGNYVYVAIRGGIMSTEVLGSRSFFNGITAASVLKKDDVLTIGKFDKELNLDENEIEKVTLFNVSTIDVYPGPEFDKLSASQKKRLLSTEMVLSKDCNRMGYRLENSMNKGLDSIITSAVLPGTVQCTPSGELIVLMRDAQVTGGYARIFQLSNMAINVLAQKRPGEKFGFKLIE